MEGAQNGTTASVLVRQSLQVLQWLDLLSLKQWLTTAWSWRVHEYLYPAPRRFPRLSSADFHVSKRHSCFRRITFENGFPEVPVVPFTVFAVIRNVFRCCPFFSVWIGNIIYKFIRIVKVNSFYNVLGCSLPSCDLRLHAEYKYTIVRINTQ